MKVVGILLSLLVSAVVIYLAYQNILSGSKSMDPLELAKPVEKARQVQSILDLSAVQTAIQTYQAQQGKLPNSLAQLVSSGLIAETQIQKLNYDPESGKVSPKE